MALQIPCPKCGSVLKLRDRSMLGRTGKCPKCSHRFTLAEPTPAPKSEEVELELAESPVEETVARPSAARRVGHAESSAATAEPPSVDLTFLAESTETSPLRSHRRKRSRQRRTEIIIGGLVALVAAGSLWAGYQFLKNQPAVEPSVDPKAPTQNVEYLSQRDRLERMTELIAEDSPTQGEAITLGYVPAGASIVVHLRPAELWKQGSIGEEVRYCLGEDFATWAETQITKYCLLPPAEIDEATICLILTARGSEPQIAAVVRPTTPRKTSELIALFDGSPQDIEGEQIYVGSERAAVIGKELDDQKRPVLFATAPAAMAMDLAQSVSAPGITSNAVEELLAETDRQRQATFVFQPADLRIHEEMLVPTDLRPAWNQMLDRFDDVEAAAWSLHFDGSEFVSELFARSVPSATPGQIQTQLSGTLEELPEELVGVVSKMNPAEVGDRKLIGRFPAMTQLFSAATVAGIGDRLVVLQTRLPERAGPNLALAGLLAWHESTRTDFTKPATESPGSTEPSEATLAERLKKPIEIDFRRTPLEEAFGYIEDETGVVFDIDGDALKLAAYTRNMPQTYSLGVVPAEKGIAAIQSKMDQLAIVLDEANNKAIVTTKSAAEFKGQTPAIFTP
ncbi:MAG: hypothetical protein WBC44_13490 [Planctomycetaceae bacterium]